MKVPANDIALGPPPGSLADGEAPSSPTEVTTWTLSHSPTPVVHGRGLVRRVLNAFGLAGDVVDDGVLMVSELIANAVRHARAPYELRIYRTDRTAICEVVDGLRLLPQIPDGKAEGLSLQDIDSIDLTRLECGRGLEVVYQLSKGHCGARFTKTYATGTPMDGKAVWFAIDLCGRELTSNAKKTPYRNHSMSLRIESVPW